MQQLHQFRLCRTMPSSLRCLYQLRTFHTDDVFARHDDIFDVVHRGNFSKIPVKNIRNFSIIAHVDHGKSTLSDSLLVIAGNITEGDKLEGQVLDQLQVERDRGITVKAQTATMMYYDNRNQEEYLINLIDTPGHIDFSYEVSRSLASCQGALLLVDSSQSIQAQTLENYEKAKKLGLEIIPVVTKIDLPNSQPEETALLMATSFGIDPDLAIMTSAKKMVGIKDIIEAVIDRLPSPNADSSIGDNSISDKFMGRIVDSWFDSHRGVVCLIQSVAGSLKEGQRITTVASIKESKDVDGKSDFSTQEIGILTPRSLRTGELSVGQVGYVIAGMRSTRQARIGDTVYLPSEWTSRESQKRPIPLPGYAAAKQMLFASVFPVNTSQLELLYTAVDKLCLNDSSISVQKDLSASLGAGLRCGFLGFLHMEVVIQRLKDEFGINVIMTTPSVPYMIDYGDENGYKEVSSVADWPDIMGKKKTNFKVLEPVVKVTLVTPREYYGAMVDLIKDRRGDEIDIQYLDDGNILLKSIVPWQEVICDMNDQIKCGSSGYATFNYGSAGFREANLVKVDISVNGESCDPLSFIAHHTKATEHGRKIVDKLKEVLPRQIYEIVLQAKVQSRVLARASIRPFRKDVLTKSGKTVGGGDITRKKKLLEKQKEGKARSKLVGKVEISQEAFWSVLSR